MQWLGAVKKNNNNVQQRLYRSTVSYESAVLAVAAVVFWVSFCGVVVGDVGDVSDAGDAPVAAVAVADGCHRR